MISVRALGPLEVTVDGKPAPPDLLWRHNVALLLYIARSPARRCTRDQAIGLLWPDKPQAAARQSLREAIRLLRRYIGEERLRTEADQLELAAGAVELDTDLLDRLIQRRDWAGATPLVRGKFADGFGLDGSSAFEDWLHAEQWHWYGREMDVLIQHAEQRLDAGDLFGADDPARRALNLDPESQRALRTLLRRLALAGDRSAALELYARFEKRAQQSGAQIEHATQALVERLRRAREWKLPPAARAAEQGVAWRRVPLLGREQELAEILSAWRQVRPGRLALVMIEAAPGGGKTRLVEEVIARAALDGGVCIATRAVPADHHQDMSGMVALARGGLLDAPGVAATSPAALAAIAREASGLGTAVIEALKAVSAEQPVLLALDDAQWLDDASLGALETMLRDLAKAPVLILLAAPPEPTTPKLNEVRAAIGRSAPGSLVRLPVFDDATLQALVRWAFPRYTADEVTRLSRRIAADSAGIPLLAVEICQAIAQGLDVSATSGGGAWPKPFKTLDQTMPGDLPDTIVAAIRVGFNTLSPAAAAALKAAAVIGERVPADRIGRAARLVGPALDAALDELEWRRWVVADPRGYSFVARIVREVVERDMVTEGERQRLLNAH
ncbi:MAG: hypothetical protein AUI08_00535 [Gemmatimonadetes bacterium 13_2_20CM_2_65_7]|nr:MAG: hypothetical protein AUI08_00535 [Gemmatimonadetes bacterium 13_2_20CM_2_65_7]OLD00818.1 MAG: hypothetical protein AUI89_05380 [Gemmatimonadetes bacterium 13_1_40CM_3_65_8]